MTRAALAGLAHRWMRLWQGDGLAAFDTLHAPDFVDMSAPDRGSDGAAFRVSITSLYDAFPDFLAEIGDLVIDTAPDAEGCARIAVRWSATGTHAGTFWNLPPRGRVISFRGIEIIAVRDGRVRRRWGEWDAQDLRRQLEEETA